MQTSMDSNQRKFMEGGISEMLSLRDGSPLDFWEESRMTTASEKSYMGRVAALGCIIPDCGSPAVLHHPRFCCGMSQRASNFLVIPLCPEHHAGELSIHKSPRQFEKLFGSEVDLLAETIRRLS